MSLTPCAPPANAKPVVWIVLYQDRHSNDRFAFLSRDAAYAKAWALVRGAFESHDRLAEYDTYKKGDELFEAWQAINYFDGELDVFDLEVEDAELPGPVAPAEAAGADGDLSGKIYPAIGFFIEEGTTVVMTEGGEGDDHLGGEHVYDPGALGTVSDIEEKDGALHSVSVMVGVGQAADGTDAYVSATFHATDDAPAFPFKLAGGAS